MEAIREIQTVWKGHVNICLLQQFWGQQVEIIVHSIVQRHERIIAKKSLRGCLRQYANAASMAKRYNIAQQYLTLLILYFGHIMPLNSMRF